MAESTFVYLRVRELSAYAINHNFEDISNYRSRKPGLKRNLKDFSQLKRYRVTKVDFDMDYKSLGQNIVTILDVVRVVNTIVINVKLMDIQLSILHLESLKLLCTRYCVKLYNKIRFIFLK